MSCVAEPPSRTLIPTSAEPGGMDRRTHGEGDDLVFVLGWGNRHDHEAVEWLVDRLVEAGYRVHVFQIPVNGTDFEADYLDPVVEFVEGLDEYRFLGHSTGGLIGAHVREPAPLTRTYLSPWWGYTDDQQGLLLDLAAKLPLSAQVLPTGTSTRESLGQLATDRMIAESPGRISPAMIRETRRAQSGLPPFEDDAVVFYAPDDQVVSPGAIEDRVPAENRVAYEGGHELFSSRSREDHLDDLLSAVAEGVAGIRDGE